MNKKLKVQLHFSAYEEFGELSNFVYETKLHVIPRMGEALFIEIENEVLACEVKNVMYNLSLKQKKTKQEIIIDLVPMKAKEA